MLEVQKSLSLACDGWAGPRWVRHHCRAGTMPVMLDTNPDWPRKWQHSLSQRQFQEPFSGFQRITGQEGDSHDAQ